MVFNCWRGRGSCLGLKRGQLGRSARGSWYKFPTHTQKTKSPWPAGGFTYWPTAKALVVFFCHRYFCGLPNQSVTVGGSIDATWCSQTPACMCVNVRTHTLKEESTNYFPPGSSWEVIRNVSVYFIFSSVCLGGVVESHQSSGPSSALSLCVCLQLRAMYIS